MNDRLIEAYKMGYEFFLEKIDKEEYKAQSEDELRYFIKGYEDAMKVKEEKEKDEEVVKLN